MKDGGPAFPNRFAEFEDGGVGRLVGVSDHPGMSLRDWFAGMAMAGWFNVFDKELLTQAKREGMDGAELNQTIAAAAYEIADAMLAEREAARAKFNRRRGRQPKRRAKEEA